MKKYPALIVASTVLFLFGAIQAVIYFLELADSGDRASAFLESAVVLLLTAWALAAPHLFRAARTAREPARFPGAE